MIHMDSRIESQRIGGLAVVNIRPRPELLTWIPDGDRFALGDGISQLQIEIVSNAHVALLKWRVNYSTFESDLLNWNRFRICRHHKFRNCWQIRKASPDKVPLRRRQGIRILGRNQCELQQRW